MIIMLPTSILFVQTEAMEASGEIFGYYLITQQYFRRYRLPVMHTETNIKMPWSVYWLQKQFTNVHRLKNDGVPIIGFTWYSLIHQVDWDTALCKDDGVINELGLYDMNRKITPVGKAYKKLITNWKDVIGSENYGLYLMLIIERHYKFFQLYQSLSFLLLLLQQ